MKVLQLADWNDGLKPFPTISIWFYPLRHFSRYTERHPRDRVSFCYLPLDLNKHMFYTLVTKRRYGRIFVRFVELGGGYLYILSIQRMV